MARKVMHAARAVLVVDDDPKICEYVEEVLTSADFTVVCAHDGAEALGVLDTRRFELAIVDLLLPGPISSDDVAARALDSHAKVITISGALASDTRGRDLRHPHLLKPFRGPALLSTIEGVLGQEKPGTAGESRL
jgi:DNA-binding response OmpR family regulator